MLQTGMEFSAVLVMVDPNGGKRHERHEAAEAARLGTRLTLFGGARPDDRGCQTKGAMTPQIQRSRGIYGAEKTKTNARKNSGPKTVTPSATGRIGARACHLDESLENKETSAFPPGDFATEGVGARTQDLRLKRPLLYH